MALTQKWLLKSYTMCVSGALNPFSIHVEHSPKLAARNDEEDRIHHS